MPAELTPKEIDSSAAFEKLVAGPPADARYVLRLYVTGMTARSTEAFAAIKAICEERLQGRYELEVVDIYQHPQLAIDEQIIAVPTLVKMLPAPLRRMIGDLSNVDRVLLGLDLRRKPE
ncbi:Circadian clock protein KaiB [Anatilimnocola aggregata]|uniref:Circadian clock protein KaiB n=1 Tax=Anatilimnocola aggregata TaxID=2528021 RepID=A0A517YMF4_9BACT|nr:circadian clock KaiB family protein [Anatilimnocola aggregata]QDU31391.1 Circadian clock protein KaiB [Anatilimnocola aggregata]